MPYPLLYLSNYFETHRDEYYSRLQRVREGAEINEWFLFFLKAVKAQAQDAIARAQQLVAIREQYQSLAMKERSSLPRLVDIIVNNPFVTTKHVQAALDLSNQGAKKLIKNAEARGWLTSLGTQGQGGRELWVASEVFKIIESPLMYSDARSKNNRE